MKGAENILSKGQELNKKQCISQKELQSEIPKQYGEDDFGLLKCKTNPRKTPTACTLQEKMIETRAWK